jgi:hypothetical protein
VQLDSLALRCWQLLELVGDELGEPRRIGLDGRSRTVEQLENAEPRAGAPLQRALADGRARTFRAMP